jgi:hypothetical protein
MNEYINSRHLRMTKLRRSRRKEVMAHAAEEIEKERSHGTCSRGDREGKKSWHMQQRRSRRKEVMAHAAEEIEKERSQSLVKRSQVK